MIRLKILITGVGITGKSTLRRTLKDLLSRIITAEDFDGDYQEMPDFKERIVYIIEDVHGTTKEACLPLNDYDLIFYLLPSPLSHLIFWFKRMAVWFKEGEGSWDKARQDWLGSGKKYDISNIPLFIGLFLYDFRHRRKWINQDIEILSQFRNLAVIQPQWTKDGIKFNLIHHF